jgi:predicted GIY-YIG superfamily endonuclease
MLHLYVLRCHRNSIIAQGRLVDCQKRGYRHRYKLAASYLHSLCQGQGVILFVRTESIELIDCIVQKVCIVA